MSYTYAIFTQTDANDAGAPTSYLVTNPTGTVYSALWTGRHSDGYGLTVITTGSLTGTFTLWMTDKAHPSTADDTDWVQDTTFSPSNPAGGAVKFRDDGGNAKAGFKRLKYVHSSGTGTIYASVNIPRSA